MTHTHTHRCNGIGRIIALSILSTIMTTQQLTAQNWTGTAGTITNLYRQGNIGIGFTAARLVARP